MKPAIVISGNPNALGVARSLAGEGVPVVVVHYAAHDMAHCSRVVAQSVKAPRPDEFEAGFIDCIRSLSARYGGGVLMPTSDEALVAVSRHKQTLAADFVVACPDWTVVERCIEKPQTYALAEKHHVPSPRTVVPRSLEDVDSYGRSVEYPCLLKPSQGHLFTARFGTKMFVAASYEQLIRQYRQAQDAGLEVMLQEIIPGEDSRVVNYNAYCWEGKVLAEFTAVHVRNAPPRFGSPRVVVSRAIPEVLESGRKILEVLGYCGFACTEFKQDPRDGVYKLMEVNARHNLSTLLAVRSGINFPFIEYRHRLDGVIPEAPSFRKEVYWIDLVRDIGYSVRHFGREEQSLAEYLSPYLREHVDAILDIRDLRPFLKRIAFLLGKGLHVMRIGAAGKGSVG